jgi:hypothetical protein
MAGSLFERLRPSSIEATPIESAPSAEEAPAAVSLLEKLEAERPLPIVELPALSPLERLQEWLDRRWRKSTISAFEIYTYGPHADRNKQTALELAGRLVQQGMLVPIRARRHDTRKWKIVRKSQRPAVHTTHPEPQPPTAAN